MCPLVKFHYKTCNIYKCGGQHPTSPRAKGHTPSSNPSFITRLSPQINRPILIFLVDPSNWLDSSGQLQKNLRWNIQIACMGLQTLPPKLIGEVPIWESNFRLLTAICHRWANSRQHKMSLLRELLWRSILTFLSTIKLKERTCTCTLKEGCRRDVNCSELHSITE